MPSTVTKQSSISPVNGVSATGVTNSSTHGLQKSSAMIYDTSVNKTTVTSTGGGNNGKKGTWLQNNSYNVSNVDIRISMISIT